MLGLARQQLRFSRRSPAITGQGAIFTHHPVAGNNHRQRIRRAGAGHGSYRPRLANMLCHGGSCGSRPPGSAAAPARPAAETRCPADPAAAIPAAGCRRGGRKSRPSADKNRGRLHAARHWESAGAGRRAMPHRYHPAAPRRRRARSAPPATTQRAVARGPVTTVPPRRNWLAVIPNAASAAIIAAAVGKTSRQRGAGHRYPLLQRFPQALRPPRLLPGFRGHAGDGFK